MDADFFKFKIYIFFRIMLNVFLCDSSILDSGSNILKHFIYPVYIVYTTTIFKNIADHCMHLKVSFAEISFQLKNTLYIQFFRHLIVIRCTPKRFSFLAFILTF